MAFTGLWGKTGEERSLHLAGIQQDVNQGRIQDKDPIHGQQIEIIPQAIQNPGLQPTRAITGKVVLTIPTTGPEPVKSTGHPDLTGQLQVPHIPGLHKAAVL